LQRVAVDRHAGLAEVARRVDVRAAVVRHGEEHHAIALNVAGLGKGFFMALPYAMDDWRLSGIGGRPVIKPPAQVDDPHGAPPTGLVSRFRSSPEFAARSGANFGIEGH